MKKWFWFDGGKFPQSCCRCGRTIPTNRARHVLNRDLNPIGTAVIKHPGCDDGKILYNGRGDRIEDVSIPEVVTA